MSAILLASSCGTFMGTGAYAGASMGSILGSAVGGISSGPRGADLGTIVGMVGGAVIGGAIGNAADQRAQERVYQDEPMRHDRYERVRDKIRHRDHQDNEDYTYSDTMDDSGFDQTNSGDDRIYDFDGTDYTGNYSAQQPTTNMPLSSSVEELANGYKYSPTIEIRNARFVDANQDNKISRGEICKVIFEVYNRGKETISDVQPMVVEAEGNKHLYISPGIHIEKILPEKGIRYTAVVKADNKLKNGTAKICISVVQGNKAISKVSEFNIPTRK
uniref:Glycine zipper domain-containing protein n=1 Tax=Prevotella sp. GTC17254 TaxID=3236794 RepID=A0AB33IZG5_9BACT